HGKGDRARALGGRARYVDALRARDQGQGRHDRLSRRRHRGAGLSPPPASARGIRCDAARYGGPGPRRTRKLEARPRSGGSELRPALSRAARFVTAPSAQDALNGVGGEYSHDAKPATTTVQVVRLATDPRCLVEINAVAVID